MDVPIGIQSTSSNIAVSHNASTSGSVSDLGVKSVTTINKQALAKSTFNHRTYKKISKVDLDHVLLLHLFFVIGDETNGNRADLSGFDLSGTNLSGTNLSGADLSGADLSNTCLNNTNLSNSNLRKVKFVKTCFKEANFSGADLSGCDLTDAVGNMNTYFFKADFTGTTILKTAPWYFKDIFVRLGDRIINLTQEQGSLQMLCLIKVNEMLRNGGIV